jgi:hypothetical protein
MLQINLVIEDAKISLDELQEQIQEIEDHVQSTDVAGEYCDDLERLILTCQPCKNYKHIIFSL